MITIKVGAFIEEGRKKEAAKNNGVNHGISFFHPPDHPSINLLYTFL